MDSRISLIICTRDHADSLHETLRVVRDLRHPTTQALEIVVVDNGSLDDTPDVVRRAHTSGTVLHYVFEPRQGLSHARNAGILAATGDILAFTDDDVRPEADWLARLVDPILNGRADASTGVVRLSPTHRQGWMTAYFRGWFETHATENYSEGPADWMIGANMAFARHTLRRVGEFDTALGAGALGFGEDSLFAAQLSAAGFQIRFVPAAIVNHYPDTSRFGRVQILRAIDKRERSGAYISHHWEHESISFCHLRSYKCLTCLRIGRLLSVLCGHRPDRVPDWEAKQLSWHLRFKYHLQLRGHARHYVQHGFSKLIDGPAVASGSQVTDP